jgi:hypothetical protein
MTTDFIPLYGRTDFHTYIALHCIALHYVYCIALHCMHCIALLIRALYCIALHCNQC